MNSNQDSGFVGSADNGTLQVVPLTNHRYFERSRRYRKPNKPKVNWSNKPPAVSKRAKAKAAREKRTITFYSKIRYVQHPVDQAAAYFQKKVARSKEATTVSTQQSAPANTPFGKALEEALNQAASRE